MSSLSFSFFFSTFFSILFITGFFLESSGTFSLAKGICLNFGLGLPPLKKRSFDWKLALWLIPLKLERGTLIVALPGWQLLFALYLLFPPLALDEKKSSSSSSFLEGLLFIDDEFVFAVENESSSLCVRPFCWPRWSGDSAHWIFTDSWPKSRSRRVRKEKPPWLRREPGQGGTVCGGIWCGRSRNHLLRPATMSASQSRTQAPTTETRKLENPW